MLSVNLDYVPEHDSQEEVWQWSSLHPNDGIRNYGALDPSRFCCR